MQKFNAKEYYKIQKDRSIQDDKRNLAIVPFAKGQALIAEYYNDKYHTNITFPRKSTVHRNVQRFFLLTLNEFANNSKQYINEAQQNTGDYRQAFILGASDLHATPVIYIREKNDEGILIVDSKGKNSAIAKKIEETSKIKVYLVAEAGQSDDYSCYTHSLKIASDTTAMDPTNTYYIPNLLTHIKDHAKEEETYYLTKLPNELLKTAQISSFVDTHKEDESEGKIIHKKENLTLFRQRYTDMDIKILSKTSKMDALEEEVKIKDISSYVRIKGIKFADLIEIQFYLNEIKKEVKTLTSEEIAAFISGSKQVLRSQGEPDEARPGLYDYADKFLADLTERRRMQINPMESQR